MRGHHRLSYLYHCIVVVKHQIVNTNTKSQHNIATQELNKHNELKERLTAGDEGAGHRAQQGLGEVLHHGRQHVALQLVLRDSTYNHLLLAAQVAQRVALRGGVAVLNHRRGGGVLTSRAAFGGRCLGVEFRVGEGLASVPVQVRQLDLDKKM